MKHIIGIDTGTNSVGWALIKENGNETVEIIDIGTYIFPIGTNVDPQSNAETTKNEQRRRYRGMKRNLFRYKLRRKQLKKILGELGMLPDFRKTYKVKKKLQSLELYELRAKAINQKIPLDEVGRIFLLLNKYRGFKSNAKKQLSETEEKDKDKKEENKKVEGGIKQLTEFLKNSGAKTIGEYYYLMHKRGKELYDSGKWHNPNELIDERADENGEIVLYNSRGIRRQYGRYVAREAYQKEFDLIWKTQKAFYPQIFTGSAEEYEEIRRLKCDEKKKRMKKFKETYYWKIRNYCIYYQRPLRSQKKYLSNCQFEKNKKVIPSSHPLFQEFRIWKNLSDLRYSCEDDFIFNQPLPLEWKNTIAEYLKYNDRIFIQKKKGGKKDKTYLIDILWDTNPTITFKIEDEETDKYIKGDLTYNALCSSIGKEKFEKLHEKEIWREYTEKNKDRKDNERFSSVYELLWHHLYMTRDDEWLKDTLVCKWEFDEGTANKLMEFELENDYGSYCAKTIKAILPYMKQGSDESTAIEFAIEECKIKERKVVNGNGEKITQLRYQELRNPVVEKSVSQIIKIVNAILEKYKSVIDRENMEIRIESTRELKKPRQERERMLRQIREKDKVREEYAEFLNKKREDGVLKFNRKIYKNDSIINKFELWLEMGMDKNDPNFTEFEKITKRGDEEKHRLWLECNRICPYTGNPINLTKLFSSEVEIEHIIPMSRSLDDSFNNKTLTFSSINHEKGNLTSFEYIKWKNDIDNFKKRIKDKNNRFSDSKKELFLLTEVQKEFTHNQISNTSYIAKYVKKKMMEVCRSVQFTNGSATAQLARHDWRLNTLLDKIRFEEENNVADINDYLYRLRLLKKDFFEWHKKKQNSTDVKIDFKTITSETITDYENETKNNLSECLHIVQQYDEFRNKTGKKDRSDHRHHAIDAFITACCSPVITRFLSTYNRAREEQKLPMYDEYGSPCRELIDRPFDYQQLKQKIKEILVCHNTTSKLITKRKNRHKTKIGIKKQTTYAPQGSLHKDGLYGKLKNPAWQGIDRAEAYVKRIPIFQQTNTTKTINFRTISDLDKIYDKYIKEIIKKRMEKYGSGEKAFSKEALEKDPLYLYSLKKYPNGINTGEILVSRKKGKPLPVIKNVRVLNKNVRNLVQLPAKDENKNVINENRYAETEGNYIMALYELKRFDKKGKEKKSLRDFRLLSFYEAVERKRKGEKLFPDEVEKNGEHLPLMKGCRWLRAGDLVLMFEKSENEINWKDINDLKQRLYKVTWMSSEESYGIISFIKHSKSGQNASFGKSAYKFGTNQVSFSNRHTQFNAIKIRLSALGEIEKVGDECFEKAVEVR